MDPWSASFLALVALTLAFWLRAASRGRFSWSALSRALAFLIGLAIAAAAVASPLDQLGEDDLLTAHLAQHIALGDFAAPLILLGLPASARRWLGASLAGLARSPARWARLATAALSPLGAFAIWAVVTYLWFVPALHRLAVPAGAVHLLDHLSFLAFGLLIWLGAFDPRPTRDLRTGLRLGGIPWWGRHGYAMVSRLAMLPPAFAVWLSSVSSYHDLSQPWSFGISRAEDQEAAASVMIGFEMLLFAFAICLLFIFVSVSEGRARARM
ncbi:MAG: cytochrome c oxidase assembly protein [Thermoleophilaceae bacterium]